VPTFIIAFILFMWFPFIEYLFAFIRVPVHEFGHALAGWFYGYPSIPAFDFEYGGGVTVYNDRSTSIAWSVGIVILGAAALLRKQFAWVILCAVLFVFLLATGLTETHEMVMSYMGHGTELIFAGIFFYRAFAGSAIKVAAERPLYAFIAWLIWLENLRFAWKLIQDAAERVMYEEAKGGGHWMDFSQIAEVYLHIPLADVAKFHFMVTLCVPAVAALLAITREVWGPWFELPEMPWQKDGDEY